MGQRGKWSQEGMIGVQNCNTLVQKYTRGEKRRDIMTSLCHKTISLKRKCLPCQLEVVTAGTEDLDSVEQEFSVSVVGQCEPWNPTAECLPAAVCRVLLPSPQPGLQNSKSKSVYQMSLTVYPQTLQQFLPVSPGICGSGRPGFI